MTERLQTLGIKALAWLAAGVLLLLALVNALLASHIDANGRVPAADALGMTALVLVLREIVASIRGVFDAASRTSLTDKLAASSPVAPPAVEPAPEGDAQ